MISLAMPMETFDCWYPWKCGTLSVKNAVVITDLMTNLKMLCFDFDNSFFLVNTVSIIVCLVFIILALTVLDLTALWQLPQCLSWVQTL